LNVSAETYSSENKKFPDEKSFFFVLRLSVAISAAIRLDGYNQNAWTIARWLKISTDLHS
jgi:hypothetical protein